MPMVSSSTSYEKETLQNKNFIQLMLEVMAFSEKCEFSEPRIPLVNIFGSKEHLLSLPLFSCTYNFVSINLDGGRKLTDNQQSSNFEIEPSILEVYASRDSLPNLNLIQFVSQYSYYRGELRKRPKTVIVRTFPTYSSDPHGVNYGQYCRYQLIKYKPWRSHISNLLGGNKDTDQQWIIAYNMFLQEPNIGEYLTQFIQELNTTERYFAQADDQSENDNDESPETTQEQWMLLCQMNSTFHVSSTTDNSIDWALAARSLPSHLLRSSPTWVSATRKETQQHHFNSHWTRQLPPVDISTLNYMHLIKFLHTTNSSLLVVTHHHCTRLYQVQQVPGSLI